MRLSSWLDAIGTYLVIAGALAAGLAASYGRELEAGRRHDLHWWLRRLLIMPMLAIVATAATELFGLPASMAAFAAAMLSLGGYDALCMIERRWTRRLVENDHGRRRDVDRNKDGL